MSYLVLFFSSTLAASLIQVYRAASHARDNSTLKWLLTALFVLALFSAFLKIYQRLSGIEKSQAVRNYNRFSLLIACMPLALYFESGLNKPIFILLVGFWALIQLRPASAPHPRSRRTLLLFSMLSLAVFGALDPALDTLVIQLSGLDQANEFTLYPIEENRFDFVHPDNQTVPADMQSGSLQYHIQDPAAEMGLRFGGIGTEIKLHKLSYASGFLLWYLPAIDYSGDELKKVTGPINADYTAIDYGPSGLQLIPIRSPYPAWMEIKSQTELEKPAPVRTLVIKLISWLFVCIVGILLLYAPAAWRHLIYWTQPVFSYLLFPANGKTAQQHRTFVDKHARLIWISAAVLLLIVIARSWPNLSLPALYVEDAIKHFKYFYDARVPAQEIFYTPNGYLAPVTYGYAWLIGLLPATAQPWWYLSFALLCSLLTVMAFSATGLVRNRVILFITPLILGLSGLNHFFYWSTVTYQIFTLIILLLTLLLIPPTSSRRLNLFRYALIMLCAWSGPYTVLVVPFSLLLWGLSYCPQNRRFYLWAAINSLLYFLTIRGGLSTIAETLQDPQRLREFAQLLFEQIYLLGLFGKLSMPKLAVLLSLVSLSLYINRHDVEYRTLSFAFISLTTINLFIYFASSKYDAKIILDDHLLISWYFWLAWIIISADRLSTKINTNPQLTGVVASGLLLVFVAVDNWENPKKWRTEKMTELPEFLRVIAEFESDKKNLVDTRRYVILNTPSSLGDSQELAISVRIGSDKPDAFRIRRSKIKKSNPWARFIAP